jgi:putative drug exporter of the RND superfamily
MTSTGPAPPSAAPGGALARMVRACAAHPWRTISAWAVAIVLILGASNAFGGALVDQFVVPGSDTQSAVDLLQDRFPERAGDSAQIVFASDHGFESAAAHEDISAAAAAAMRVPGVIGAGDPYTGQAGAISEDQRVAFIDVQFDTPASEVEDSTIQQLEDDVRAAVGDGDLQVEFGGSVVNGKSTSSETSEILGLLAAVVVLLIVLGSAVAMSIPITLALVSVGLGMSLLTLGAAFTDFNTITPILAVMIGLGVAIDYSLFIVTRFRQALAEGERPVDAAVTAGSTAGRAVIFAGATVAISISGLMLIGIPFVTKLGLGTAMSVVVAVCVAVTLLPAVLAAVGHRIDTGRVPFVGRRASSDPEKGFVGRLSRLVARHPKTAALSVLAVLVTLAIPALSMTLGTADAGTNPPHTTTRNAYDLMAEGFGPGVNGPLLVAVDQKDDSGASKRLVSAFAATPGVAAVTDPISNEAGDTTQIAVYPTTSPQSSETAALVHTLRDDVIPSALGATDAVAYVGGTTATNEDVASKIGDKMLLFLTFIVGITCLVLTMAFRSIVVAVKAAVTTLLSAAAAFGVLVAVFEWGWGGDWIGLDRSGPTSSFLPVIILSILFGLSMDYEVFLASRIREEHVDGVAPRRAVTDGVRAVGRVIIGAAVIMGVVFLAFVLSDDRVVKSFGLGLGVAILVDALLVRLVLVPAIMHLLGRRAWYIPRWLDRALPKLTIEPPSRPTDAPQDDAPAAAPAHAPAA